MALKDAILAALLEGDSWGYDLAKSFDASIANFWSATPQQLYRELERMESEGLVRAQVVQQERRPNKRLFSLTEAGHRALRDFTRAPTRPTALRDELLVKVQAVDDGDPAAVREAVEARLELAQQRLARYGRLRERLLGGRSEQEHLAHAPRVGPYLTLLRGIAFETETAGWAQLAIRVLDERGGAD